jgi:8-oxo-dGTP pyrophosphatase MutT (NUDIX family)
MQFKKAIKIIENKLAVRQPLTLQSKKLIPSAVAIPLLEKNNEAYLLFTVRTDKVEHHKGQISFPGGARESHDKSLEDTAVREFYEEVGIPKDLINIIGRFDDFPTITNFLVTPFVATIPNPYPKNINKKEVEDILEVPLALFLSDSDFEVKTWRHKDREYPVYFYYFERNVIWGATAFIFNRFIEQIFEYNPAPKSMLRDPGYEEYLQENRTRKGKLKNG